MISCVQEENSYCLIDMKWYKILEQAKLIIVTESISDCLGLVMRSVEIDYKEHKGTSSGNEGTFQTDIPILFFLKIYLGFVSDMVGWKTQGKPPLKKEFLS